MADIFILLVAIIFLVWMLYSVLAIIYPIAPFTARKPALKSFGLSLAATVSGLFVLGVMESDRDISAKAAIDDTAAQVALASATVSDQAAREGLKAGFPAQTRVPEPCGNGGLVLDDVVAVTGAYDIHQTADASSPQIKNEKASAALGRAHYHRIDASTTVKRLCHQSDWTQIQIVTPEWLNFVEGWVPTEALRDIDRDTGGARVYVMDDFYWDNSTKNYQSQIVTVVNRIARENKNCGVIDPYSVALSGSRSTPNDPVFYVTCGSGMDALNVWFRPGDADAQKTFAAIQPLEKTAAVNACERAAKNAATHPSTVGFSRVWDLAYMPHKSGRSRVVSSFTANNGLGLELKYRIDCLFDGATLIETNIAEKT